MYHYQYALKGKINKHKLWDLYTIPKYWKEWDIGVTKRELEGHFENGVQGRLYINDVPTATFTLEEVDPYKRFVETTIVESITLKFIHEIVEVEKGMYEVIHSVTVETTGEDNVQELGESLVLNIPESLEKLLALAV